MSKFYMTEDFPQLVRSILESADGPILAKEIGQQVGIKIKSRGAIVRKAVAELRREGIPVASGRDGYYLAKTKGELAGTIRSLRGRIQAIQESLDGLLSFKECL